MKGPAYRGERPVSVHLGRQKGLLPAFQMRKSRNATRGRPFTGCGKAELGRHAKKGNRQESADVEHLHWAGLGTAGPEGESWDSESRETPGQWRIV